MSNTLNLAKLLFAVVLLSFLLMSCHDDSEEDILRKHFGSDYMCDTTEVSFSADVQHIFQANCIECHSGQFPSGTIDLTSYEGTQPVAEDGRLVGAIKHEDGYVNMPEGRDKLRECDINIIKAWVDQGIQNN